MGTGYNRTDTVNNIATGNIINAADLDAEYDAIAAAFEETTGHTHDGSDAQGAPITKVGPTQEVVISNTGVIPKANNLIDLGSALFQYKDAYIDGTAYIDALDLNGTVVTSSAAELNLLDGVTATTTEINYIDGVTSSIQTQLDARQPLDAQLTDIAGLTPTDNSVIIGNGTNFVTESGSTVRTSLGLAIGVDVQAYDAQLADIAGLTPTDNNFIVGNGTNFVAESGATARTSLGLGSIATQDASNVSITGGSVSGITDLAIADGGTGASTANAALNNLLPAQTTASGKYLKSDGTNSAWDDLNISTADITGTLAITNGGTGSTSASAARTALGLAIGTDVQAYDADLTTLGAGGSAARSFLGLVIGTDVQAYDAQLADVAGLTPTDNGVIIGNGTNFVVESGATLKTSLGLTIGTDVQAYDAQLADIAGLTPSDNSFIVGNGTNFVVESGATARTSLGLGSAALASTTDFDPAGTAVALAIALG